MRLGYDPTRDGQPSGTEREPVVKKSMVKKNGSDLLDAIDETLEGTNFGGVSSTEPPAYHKRGT
jgi:hypothetical protein